MNILVSHVTKKYDDKVVLQDFSAEFEEHKTTVIMGKSGCGKTTLLHLILNLIREDTGSITGVPKNVAAVFQEDRLCEDFSVLSNLKLTAAMGTTTEEICHHLLRMGIGEEIYKPVKELSGGMKRRVAIARAILAPAELIVMDEPLKGLDEKTRHDMIDYIRAYTTDKTLLLVTHDAEEAQLFGGKLLQM